MWHLADAADAYSLYLKFIHSIFFVFERLFPLIVLFLLNIYTAIPTEFPVDISIDNWVKKEWNFGSWSVISFLQNKPPDQ